MMDDFTTTFEFEGKDRNIEVRVSTSRMPHFYWATIADPELSSEYPNPLQISDDGNFISTGISSGARDLEIKTAIWQAIDSYRLAKLNGL
ncbi:hypothetical protein [Deminuibacter soli]|uniref:Uncharacterized protein n=1 Tax=Deminuibacter soli TaxID=2291815 RepID=A0A3E1NQ35_9BACT|nr:hypothetical protein [Deminuibacter soli]RFM30045.1 hypothetical protein DXN05_03475 [Deminuibacter soli]